MVIFDAIYLDISIWYNAIYRIPGYLSIFWGLLQCSFWQSSSFLVDFWWARPWWSSSKMKVARSAGVAIYKKHQKTMALSEAAALGHFIVGWHIVLQISLISWTLKAAFLAFQSLCGLSFVPKRVWFFHIPTLLSLFTFHSLCSLSYSKAYVAFKILKAVFKACAAFHIPKHVWPFTFQSLCGLQYMKAVFKACVAFHILKPVWLFIFQSLRGFSHSKVYVAAFYISNLCSKSVWLFTFQSMCGFSHSQACVAFHIPKPVLVSVVTSLFLSRYCNTVLGQ